ncbi:hypothetical protein D3C73_849470 [compost metagenome]
MRHQRFAGRELGVEGGVVEGEDAFLGGDQLITHGGDLFRVAVVDRPALGEEPGAEHPAVGGEHGHLALERIAGVEQFVPAHRGRGDLVGAVADAGGAPGVRHRKMVTRVVFQFRGLGIEVLQVGDLDRIDVRQQPLFVQDFSEWRGDEHHVIPFSARGHELAHDLFVGRVQGLVDLDAAGRLELVQRIRSHVAVPDGNHHVFRSGRLCSDCQGNAQSQTHKAFQLSHNTHPTIVYFLNSKAVRQNQRNDCMCFFLEIRTSIKRCQRFFLA